MNLFAETIRAVERGLNLRATSTLSLDDYIDLLGFGNMPMRLNQTLRQDREEVGSDFAGLVNGAFKSNAIIFACELKRMELFMQARFAFQQMRDGRPGDLFGTPALRLLEKPEPGRETGDLLMRVLLHADLGGTGFVVKRSTDRLRTPRPDWMTMVLGSHDRDPDPNPLDLELIGAIYSPHGIYSGKPATALARDEVAVFAPVPDPDASYRGLPWIVPVIRELMGDQAATTHKLKFFENGATANMVVTLDPRLTVTKAKEWIDLFEQEHKGVMNAYKTIYLGGGASQEVVGANMRQIDFKATQGAGETRIAAASGMHPVIAALSEGLQGSSLNDGNFRAAMELVASTVLRSMWGNLAGSLEVLVPPPSGSRLWYDERDIPFLKADIEAAAKVQSAQAQSIRTLTDGGYTPVSVIDSVTSGDMRRLEHSGYLPVQVQPIQGDGDDEDKSARLITAPMGYTRLPQLTAGEFRCAGLKADGKPCRNLLAEAGAPGTIARCDRCKARSKVDESGQAVLVIEEPVTA